MDFALTEEQQMIADSASDWLLHHYDLRQRAASLQRDGGNPAVWQAMAELGWLGLLLPEDAGGMELGALEAGLLAQAMGRHLVVEPVLDGCLEAARLLALAGSPAQQADWLPGVVAGTQRLALAHAEGSRLPWDAPQLRARANGAGWVLDGSKRCIASAPGAARWIVSAVLADGSTALFLVDPQTPGICMDAYDTSNGGRAADIAFDAVHVDAASRLNTGNVQAALQRVLAEGLVARCWAATGCMQAMLAQTSDHVQQRQQFGQPLARFQVVQHRLAEMAVLCAEAQAACELASLSLAGADAADAAQGRGLASLLKNKVGRAARTVAQEGVQLHGAMGVCEELPIASAFRALMAFAQWGGDGASHALDAGSALLADGSFAQSRTLGPAPTHLAAQEPETVA
ncbi:acyl-CoA dehydrogenase family protein [Pantoea sp. 18069]|uniref:acyl-CoA dehydrogenase family protein n=1 Tax=Pantoea sp. 18069 TaxID=2681415 RepID=UPI0013567C6D|nr:acyl-CoA dehydrogenase [Pantoea sp. 18069]